VVRSYRREAGRPRSGGQRQRSLADQRPQRERRA